jgi:esterase/lipase superfamily enzyme
MDDPAAFYGSDAGDLELGTVSVSVPATHKLGEIEEPNWYLMQFRPDPNRHIMLWDSPRPLVQTAFISALSAQIARSKRKEIFVFVHGFNTSFADAALRTAQMAYDLNIDGAPMMFSWPSRGDVLSYVADRNLCGPDQIGKLTAFLTMVVRQSGAQKIDVLAHSMGNCFLTQALNQMAQNGMQNAFSEVVFAAPDYDPDDFRALIPAMRKVAPRMTLYASSNDYAMMVSKEVNGRARVGDARVRFADPSIDSIDASDVLSPDEVGHSYFAGGALGDLRAVLWDDLNPPSRCVLQRLGGGGGQRWLLAPAHCDEEAFETAVLLLRQKGPAGAATAAAQLHEAALAEHDQLQAGLYRDVQTQLSRMTAH